MSKQETITILMILGAFYSGGKNDPKMQADAWHMILQKYDFDTAKIAVLKFAESDTRDYATFPAVGKIVQAIKNEEKERIQPILEIKMAISHGKDYDALPIKNKSIISREMYNKWLAVNAEEFEQRASEFMGLLKNSYNRRLISGV